MYDVLQLEDVSVGDVDCRYVYKGRRFAVRRCEYGGCGIVDTVGSLLARYATKAMIVYYVLHCRYVYKGRRFAVRRYEYGGCGIVDTVGSLLARYATKAMLATAATAALRGGLDVAKRAVPHVIAHEVATTIARKRKRIDKGVTGSQDPQLKKASVGGIDINALIDGSGIVLD